MPPGKRRGNGSIENVTWRVRNALPEWWTWPRSLRRLYMMLATFGATEDGIRDYCEEFGYDQERLMKTVEADESFRERLREYREKGQYARGVKRNGQEFRSPLSQLELRLVFEDEEEFSQFLHLAALKAAGKGADFAAKLYDQKGMGRMVTDVARSSGTTRNAS